MSVVIGIDVGGTKIAAGLVSRGGEVTRLRRIPTPRDPAAVLDAMTELAVDLIDLLAMEGRVPAGIGVGTGGIVDVETGTIVEASDVIAGWVGVAVAAELRRRTGVSAVRVDNDGNAFALAEWRWGAARGAADALFVAVGTGIGGGLVLDGRLRRGPRGIAGELGRLPLHSSDGAARRTLEDVAAGPALAAAYVRASGHSVDGLKDVAARAAAGERLAREVLEAGAEAVGLGVAQLAVTIDVPLVVVGGGVADIGESYVGVVREAAARAASGAELRVLAASRGSTSSVAGAGALVL